ncbi:MAG: hypothetical protein H8D33_04585 [Cryomorphaceae bacterium]|nr:hypothetical protein [Cryomorphaceae bacterium]
MNKLTLITLLACAFTIKAQQNLVLNGSFENNTPPTDSLNNINCWIGLETKIDYENTIHYSYHFGDDYTISLFKLPCLICFPPVTWGGIAKDGDWALIMGSWDETIILPPLNDTTHLIKQGKVSLALNAPLSNTKRYKLSFWIKETPPDSTLHCIMTKDNYVNVGISNYNDLLGKHLVTTNYGDSIWQEYTYVFETQMAEEYITVTVGVNDTIDYSVFIDHFVLTETTEPLTTGVNEIYTNSKKQLLKIVDILGKESNPNKKGLLFYIYSDGTVEKKLIIE